jgi:hypothetical protein
LNVSFEVIDIEGEEEDLWGFKGKRDFTPPALIHARNLTPIRNWDLFFERCFRLSKLGGWIEVSSDIFSQNSAVPKGSGMMEMIEGLRDMMRSIGCDPDYPKKFSERLEIAGFAEVTQITYRIPCSGWDEEGHSLSNKLAMVNFLTLAKGWLADWFTPIKLQQLVERTANELKGSHSCYLEQ